MLHLKVQSWMTFLFFHNRILGNYCTLPAPFNFGTVRIASEMGYRYPENYNAVYGKLFSPHLVAVAKWYHSFCSVSRAARRPLSLPPGPDPALVSRRSRNTSRVNLKRRNENLLDTTKISLVHSYEFFSLIQRSWVYGPASQLALAPCRAALWTVSALTGSSRVEPNVNYSVRSSLHSTAGDLSTSARSRAPLGAAPRWMEGPEGRNVTRPILSAAAQRTWDATRCMVCFRAEPRTNLVLLTLSSLSPWLLGQAVNTREIKHDSHPPVA